MKLNIILSTVVAAAATLAFTTGAAGATSGVGLWSTTTTGNATSVADCGSGGGVRTVDAGAFCVIDEDGAVELGVRFTTAQPVLATGVRVYRVDPGTVTGSLWSAEGVLLATGTFAAQAGHGWQDLLFPSPVLIQPGQTYTASYAAPSAVYAYEWNYFTNTSVTSGPITALQSVDSGGNGVYSYCGVGQDCNPFPTSTYNDSNYWVSPLWSPYLFSGFAQPVDTDRLNTVKAGSAIPVKFGLGGDMGLGILADGYPQAKQVPCDAGVVVDAIETTVTAGSSTLTYDAVSGRYVYVWKTAKAWAGSCYRFDLGLNDGSHHTFDVKFTK